MTILFLKKYEAGIVLQRYRGKISENGKNASIKEAFIKGGVRKKMYIYGMHISPYEKREHI